MAGVIHRIVSFLAVAAVVAALLLLMGIVPTPWSHAKHDGAEKKVTKEPTPVAVTVAPTMPRPIQRNVYAVGTLYGFEEVTVTPKIEGVVTRILHDVGDSVSPGEPLLEIEETYYRLAENEAERALELELAKIGLKKLPLDELEIDRIPMVAKAKAEEQNARSRATRAKELRASNALALQEYENAAAEYEVAVAKREHAALEALATLAAARHKQATLQTARQKLAETKVCAPEPSKDRFRNCKIAPVSLKKLAEQKPNFVVAQRLVAEGEMVRAFPSVAVFRLVIDQPLKLISPIPERHIGEVQAGQIAKLQVEAYPNEVFEGTVSRVNPVIDRTSRTFQVEILIPNEDRRLKAGGFCQLAIATHVDSQAVTVPQEALVTFAGVTKVFVVKDGKAKAVPVQPGVRIDTPGKNGSETWVEISAAAIDGPVVTSGHSKLADGTPVRIRD